MRDQRNNEKREEQNDIGDTDLRTLRRDPHRPDDGRTEGCLRHHHEVARPPAGSGEDLDFDNPKLAKVISAFGTHFQPGGYSLTEREREIAVCVILTHWHAAYPTAAHERRGKEVGLPAAKVEAIIGGMPTSFDDAREQVVYEMATVLANG